MYYRDTIIAGRTKLIALRAVTRTYIKGEKRKPRMNPTPEAVARTNFRNAVKMLTAKLNHNFVPGDYHLTLTYEKVKAPADAKKCLDNFIRKVRSACKKEDVVLKWVAVTEYKQHRIHHHLVISGIDVDTLDRCWKYGRINVAPLDPSGNYHRLAEYLLKETEETFRQEGSPNKRRYSCSRSIVTPEIRREKISSRQVWEEIKPPKGYYVDEDTVRMYEHAILGVECKEYILISLDGSAKGKRGKPIRPEKVYQTDKQLSMEEMAF